MAILIKIEGVRTYATRDNAIKAVEKVPGLKDLDIRYFIHTTEDEPCRYFPVFIGIEAVQAGLHFKFNVVG